MPGIVRLSAGVLAAPKARYSYLSHHRRLCLVMDRYEASYLALNARRQEAGSA
jgi:hypothetical protein